MGQVLADIHHVAVEEVNSGHWLDKETDHLTLMYLEWGRNLLWLSLDLYAVSLTQSLAFPFNQFSLCQLQLVTPTVHVQVKFD